MQELLRKEINPDEELVWSGIPEQGVMLKSGDVFMIPFSLMWGGFAIFWEYSVINSDAPFFFMLWGIPFVLVGVYLIFGRFIYDAQKRSKTIYGLTKNRAIIISGLFGRKVKSLNLKSLPEIHVKTKSNGSGTITFGSSSPMHFFQGSGWPGTSNSIPAFEGIENVQLVKQYIYQYQNT